MTIGIVIIGRNEGDRLVRCLESLREFAAHSVYVDSGSTDRSVEEARARGVEVVELDTSRPFTAARARNAGFRRVRALHPGVQLVHFFDGDCEVQPGWVRKAAAFLERRPDVGVVFGEQKERFPERSIYNQLFDVEWDVPQGEVASCAGNSMCRSVLFEQLGGFREDLIAGEDPEFCLRVRKAGFKIWRLDEPMVLHDAAMTRFKQWWRRAMRAGHAFAEGASLHGAPPERHFVRETRSQFIWGLGLPLFLVAIAIVLTPWALLGFLVYPLQVLRVARKGRRTAAINFLHAAFVVLGKFPEAAGGLKYYRGRLRRGPARLIEYK